MSILQFKSKTTRGSAPQEETRAYVLSRCPWRKLCPKLRCLPVICCLSWRWLWTPQLFL